MCVCMCILLWLEHVHEEYPFNKFSSVYYGIIDYRDNIVQHIYGAYSILLSWAKKIKIICVSEIDWRNSALGKAKVRSQAVQKPELHGSYK